MRIFWEIWPLILMLLLLVLAGYILLAPGPRWAFYPARFLVGGMLVVYALLRGFFWYKRWKARRSQGV